MAVEAMTAPLAPVMPSTIGFFCITLAGCPATVILLPDVSVSPSLVVLQEASCLLAAFLRPECSTSCRKYLVAYTKKEARVASRTVVDR